MPRHYRELSNQNCQRRKTSNSFEDYCLKVTVSSAFLARIKVLSYGPTKAKIAPHQHSVSLYNRPNHIPNQRSREQNLNHESYVTEEETRNHFFSLYWSLFTYSKSRIRNRKSIYENSVTGI